jgi:hypothetical protein
MILERLLGRLVANPVPAEAGGLAAAEGRRRRRPGHSVAGQAVCPQPGTERDQRRQVGHGLDRSRIGDADEPVSVEVVALVDRLQPERVALLTERREDRIELALLLRPQRGLPQPALTRGLEGDRLPEARRYSQRASSFVQ